MSDYAQSTMLKKDPIIASCRLVAHSDVVSVRNFEDTVYVLYVVVLGCSAI